MTPSRHRGVPLTLLAAAALVSCGNDATPTPTPAANTWTIASGEYTLAPGEERYLCTTATLPADRETVITAMTPTYGTGTHHIFFAQTLAPEDAGTFECRTLFRTTWAPLYLGGVQSGTLQLPRGAGIRLSGGQQVLIQLHLQNASASPIRARTSMTLTLADPAAPVVAAGVFGVDNRTVRIPARSTNHRTAMTCRPNRDMNVFAVLGHMHKYGSRLEFVRGGVDSTDALYETDWNFGEQPTTPRVFTLRADESVSLRCFHSNTTSAEVPYGESSDQEMCASVMYYTPFDQLDGCIEDGTARDDAGSGPGDASVPLGDGGVPVGSCVQPGENGNEQGVGRFCTARGNQCAGNAANLCLAALAPTEGQWFCTHLCTMDSQCGAGSVCVGDSRGRVCMPARCAPSTDAGPASDGGAADASTGRDQ
ncbi:MAG: hypothetical protein EPO40_14930 [Myxococcaceae bacterium]|nr:MAG: hypothetical protein EPO40_14930 [Myxococcaceae bacterium]